MEGVSPPQAANFCNNIVKMGVGNDFPGKDHKRNIFLKKPHKRSTFHKISKRPQKEAKRNSLAALCPRAVPIG